MRFEASLRERERVNLAKLARTAHRELRLRRAAVALVRVGNAAGTPALGSHAVRRGRARTPVVVWGGREPERLACATEIPVLGAIPESDRPVISLPLPMLGTAVHAATSALLYPLREVALRGLDTRVAHFEQPGFAWS